MLIWCIICTVSRQGDCGSETLYYFAYSTNLKRTQMASTCPGSKALFRAVLPNYKLIFTGWQRQWRGATASIKPFQGEKAPGAVYEVSEADLRRLDRAEGYPSLRSRMNVLVLDDEGEAHRAVTYIKREQSQEGQPSAEYVALIRQGYRDWEI